MGRARLASVTTAPSGVSRCRIVDGATSTGARTIAASAIISSSPARSVSATARSSRLPRLCATRIDTPVDSAQIIVQTTCCTFVTICMPAMTVVPSEATIPTTRTLLT